MSLKLALTAVTIVGVLSTVPLAAQAVEYGMSPHARSLAMKRRHRHGLSYGTGYHGRGTATGGPVGGLPSRN